MPLKLHLTQDQFEKAHSVVAKAKGDYISIEASILEALLHDHSLMYGKLEHEIIASVDPLESFMRL